VDVDEPYIIIGRLGARSPGSTAGLTGKENSDVVLGFNPLELCLNNALHLRSEKLFQSPAGTALVARTFRIRSHTTVRAEAVGPFQLAQSRGATDV
jgi:hypothetical protein